MIESELDLLLLLLYADKQKEIVGITKLEKLIFLLVFKEQFKKFRKVFGFEAYDYGPWSSQLLDCVETLNSYDLITIEERNLPPLEKDYYQDEIELNFDLFQEFIENKTKVFSLTSDGLAVASELFSKLSEKEKESIMTIKRTFNYMPVDKLIRYVYHCYPEFTKKSVIKEKVRKLSPEEELKLTYPDIKIDKKLLAIVGILPSMALEEEKQHTRKIIRERYHD